MCSTFLRQPAIPSVRKCCLPRLWVATLLLAAATGCQPAGNKPVGRPQAISVAPSLKPADINIVTGDVQALGELLASHKGQVVFVDYWATWCEPCVQYFPHTVELSHKYKDRGLATIAVSFDDPAEEQTVREFLAQHRADFSNLISSYDLGPAAFEAFDINQVPHFRLYDRQGKLRYRWEAAPDDAQQRITELLAESP